MIRAIRRLKRLQLPAYLKGRYIVTGLVIGALWGFLSMAIFITVGMFGDTGHPYHWLFQFFQNSVHTLWFRSLFLPFLLALEAGSIAAFFGSTLLGALIGVAIGAIASVIEYIVRTRS